MSAEIGVSYNGLKEALRDLQKVSPALRRELSKEMLGVLRETVVPAIQDTIPSTSPLSGMDHRGRTGWAKANQQRSVVAKVDTRKARRRNLQQGAEWESVAVVKVVTKTAALAIADMAGRGPNRSRNLNPKMARPFFADTLTSKLGRGPSRFVWHGGERSIEYAQRRLEPIVEKIAEKALAGIVKR